MLGDLKVHFSMFILLLCLLIQLLTKEVYSWSYYSHSYSCTIVRDQRKFGIHP